MNYQTKTGKEVLQELEEHCQEKLNCSHRLRFQLESTIQRQIDEQNGLITRISNVLNGFSTYDSKQYTTRVRPDRKKN